MEDLKFTKEIKENWLAALKSGEYIQGDGRLRITDIDGVCKHCCLGVLASIHPELSIDSDGYGCIFNDDNTGYVAFESLLNSDIVDEIWQVNDRKSDGKYTAVIPLIEAIPTEDEN